MADKYLNQTGLQYFFNRIKTIFENKIETVKVNDSALTPDSNKAVNVKTPTLTPDTSSVTVKNGTDQTSVKVINDTNGVQIDAKGSDGTDIFSKLLASKSYADSTFRTQQQVQDAIDAAIAGITQFTYEVVSALPTTGEVGKIYLVSNTGSSPNTYDEYIWIAGDPTGRFEKIGTTAVDLSQYWAKTELTAITTAEIDTLFE